MKANLNPLLAAMVPCLGITRACGADEPKTRVPAVTGSHALGNPACRRFVAQAIRSTARRD